MDNKDIDDILQAVNSTNGIENNNSFLNMLHHRTPNQPQFKSFDPVNSVSSSDSTPPSKSLVDVVNTLDTSKISNSMKQILNQINDSKLNQSMNTPVTTHESISNPPINVQGSGNSSSSSSSNSSSRTGPSLISVMGYSIPESTLYFVLVLAIIAVALYFLTSDGKKDKEKEKIKN